MLQHASNKKDEKHETVEEENQSATAPSDRRALLDSKDNMRRRRSILTLQTDDDGKHCVVVEKNVLTSSNDEDVDVLRKVAHYSIYAQWIYFHVKMIVEDLLATEDATTFIRDFEMMAPMEHFSLARFEAPHAHLWYASFHNGLAATPYAILVDEEEQNVVIAVRGTLSLEGEFELILMCYELQFVL